MPHSRIQLRRGKSIFWRETNPILHMGEPGYETNTRRLKVGDGKTPWNQLKYFTGFDVDTGVNDALALSALVTHISSSTPHSVYDDGPSLTLLYENAKV